MPEKPNLPVKSPRSGVYSWVNSKRIPSGRAFQKIRRELSIMREELLEAHGGERIGPDAAILVDSVIEGLGVQKLLGLYTRKYGVIDGQAVRAGRLELAPILAKNWISYANTVRQGILALREIDKGRGEHPGLTPLEIAAEIDAEKEAQGEPPPAVAGNQAEGEEIASPSAAQPQTQADPANSETERENP